MNDVTSLNWEKIHKFEPEDERRYEDRPYTRQELKKLLDKTNQRNRVIILLLSSSGCRVGVIPTLRIRDLVPIDKHQIYKVIAYAKSNKSRYYTFCSPEARKEIDDYLAWRKRRNEKLTDESPVFRQEFNLQKDSRVQSPKPLTVNSIGFIMNKLLKQTGIRQVQPLIAGQCCGPRTEIQQLHGTRKYFETTAFKAGMSPLYIRRLLGQKGSESSLEESYLKLTEEDLLEGDSRHVGYIGIMDALTINEENRLRKKVETLTIERNRIEAKLDKIDQLAKKLGITDEEEE
jgi:integrase